LLAARLAVHDFGGARNVARSLINLWPTASLGFGKLAIAERAAGRLTEAAEALQEAIVREPDDKQRDEYKRQLMDLFGSRALATHPSQPTPY
jgi:predicted TPR repeat methyltransferase